MSFNYNNLTTHNPKVGHSTLSRNIVLEEFTRGIHWFYPLAGSTHGLTDAQQVAFAVSEPGAFLASSLAGIVTSNFSDAVHCL